MVHIMYPSRALRARLLVPPPDSELVVPKEGAVARSQLRQGRGVEKSAFPGVELVVDDGAPKVRLGVEERQLVARDGVHVCLFFFLSLLFFSFRRLQRSKSRSKLGSDRSYRYTGLYAKFGENCLIISR